MDSIFLKTGKFHHREFEVKDKIFQSSCFTEHLSTYSDIYTFQGNSHIEMFKWQQRDSNQQPLIRKRALNK